MTAIAIGLGLILTAFILAPISMRWRDTRATDIAIIASIAALLLGWLVATGGLITEWLI